MKAAVSAGRARTAAPSLALQLLLLLGSERYTPSCLAFLLPAAKTPVVRSTASPPATAVARRCKTSSRRVALLGVPWRTCSALAASGDGDGNAAGPVEDSVDIFDALMAGDMAFITEYVQAGGDCSVQDSIGDTPLMLAVESELTPAVRTLIKEGGADVNLASKTTGETPLMLAAYYGHTNLARVLVGEGGAELELRNKKGETALSLACFWGNEDTVEYLLEIGADPNSRSESGERPGDSFDTVFVPDVVENFFTADEANALDSASEGDAIGQEDDEEEEEEDIMFDDDEMKDIMVDDEETRAGEGKDHAVSAGEGEGDEEQEEEPPGPREAILAMLEKARAEAAAP